MPHDANLAEAMTADQLARIAADLIEGIEADWDSNAEMRATFEVGRQFVIVQPGNRIDTPFEGAAGVVHPLLLEAMLRFAASALAELLPAAGPVRMQINGDKTPESEARAQRKKDWLNYYLTTKDEDYVPDFDQMLMLVGFHGSMFRKVYRDPAKRGMPVSRSLSPIDLIVNYAATSLHGSQRVTHRERLVGQADLKKLQIKGWYRDVALVDGGSADGDEDVENVEGREASSRIEDATYTLDHCHCLLDLEGLEHRDDQGEPTGLPLPYIVTVHAESREVLRIARNWTEGDDEFDLREYYVHYKHTPGFGFYGWGLVHLLGSVTDALTMMRRQALNAFTLKTFPGGVRTKGARVEDSYIAVGPGQWPEIDTGGLPIQQAMMPLPYADVPLSFQPIMQEMLESGQRVGSTGDMAVGEGREDALPGTVIALIEQAKKLESSVIRRLHTAQRKELRLLADLFGADPEAKYPYTIGDQSGVALAADFADNQDIVPVSDPNIPTQTQRLAQAQATMQIAQASNGLVDVRAATENFFRTMGKSDQEIARLMPPPQQGQPSDVVTEFASALKSMPLAAGPQQDHAAHIQAHLGQLATPGLDKTPVYQALIAHIGDHMGLFYAGEASRLTGIPMLPGQIPPGQEAQVAQAVAAATDQLRLSLAQFAPHGGDPIEQAKLQIETAKLRQADQKMVLDAHEQDRKAAQAALSQQNDMTKLAVTTANEHAQRESELEINRHETERSLLSMRTAQVSAGAQVAQQQIERDAAIATGLLDHDSQDTRAAADVSVAQQHRACERHKVEAARAKAVEGAAKP